MRDRTGTGRRCAALAASLMVAGCVGRPAWQPPVVLNSLPPPGQQYGATGLQSPYMPSYLRPSPERLTPFLQPPQRSYEPPSYAPEREPPYSDGTPFSLSAPPASEPARVAPPVAEAPPPVRAAEPTSAVPMVGFRPMRSQGGKSY